MSAPTTASDPVAVSVFDFTVAFLFNRG